MENEKKKLDFDKKYRTVDDHYPIRIICTDRDSEYNVIYLYNNSIKEYISMCDNYGYIGAIKLIEEIPSTDWSTLKVDTPIWVNYKPRHFAKYENNKVHFFTYGTTSHSCENSDNLGISDPKYVSLTKP